jgi:hypothetical protein
MSMAVEIYFSTRRCYGSKKGFNACVGQFSNFSLDIDDTYGPVVSASGELDTTGAEAHPWANFSR